MNNELKISIGYMVFASILAIILGFIMLMYPGGTMALMATTFWALQVIVSIFILAYSLSEAARNFKDKRTAYGFAFILIGVLATLFVWVFNITIIYIIVALFFILTGLAEFIGSRQFFDGRYFVAFLGLINVMIGAIILMNPVVLPLLIAWYVLFWGISRLFLALELKRITSQ